MSGITISISSVLTIIWAVILYKIGSSRKRREVLFYLFASVPIFISLLVYSVIFLLAGIKLLIVGVIFLLILAERMIWIITLRDASGEKKVVWFIIVMFVPVLGWLLYWVTKW